MRGLILTTLLSVSSCAFSNGTDTLLLEKHLKNIVETDAPRKYTNLEVLDQVAAYIFDVFESYADTTYYQEYEAYDQTYRNVISVFGPMDAETVVIGAHYDVCGDQDGADDNASGVAGLLELARQ